MKCKLNAEMWSAGFEVTDIVVKHRHTTIW